MQRRVQDLALTVLRLLVGAFEKRAAFRDLHAEVCAGLMLELEVMAERAVHDAPGLDGKLMTADPVRFERRLPPIIDDEAHRHAAPHVFVRGPPQHVGREQSMALTEDIGFDRDGFADD